MKLNDYFKQFLSNIEPTSARVSAASTSHNAVRDHLSSDDEFKKILVDTFLAGSYARDTAYDPIQDVDIIVVAKWDREPAKLLAALKSALDRNKNYKTKCSPQRRSIRIDLSHISLDIVPAREVSGLAPLQVPDREQKEWVGTNPKGHIDWVTTLNKATKQNENDQGRFVPLAKMFKHWSRYHLADAKHPKGFWIECLAGWNHDSAARDWADVFIRALELITSKYAVYRTSGVVPQLTDPGLPHQTLTTGLEAEDFQAFYAKLEQSLADARKARVDETSAAESAKLWRVVFGPKFPSKDQRDAQLKLEQAVASSSAASVGIRSGRDVREPEPFGSEPLLIRDWF
jgi:hypothetical protein